MIVPSIDLQNGNAVQLIGGKELEIDAGDPQPLFEQFSVVGDVAVIDLDAAMGKGNNRAVIEKLISQGPCRVGGGIRDVESAIRWLDAGAEKIILGTAAKPELLQQLPRERVMAAVDAVDGEVVVEGWQTKTGASLLDVIAELRPYVGGFLVTFVEREGRLQGTDLDRVKEIIEAAGEVRVTFAGGVSTEEEIATIDALGADAQVGMAIYSGRMSLAGGFAAPLSSDRADGLFPTVVTSERGEALGLCWSSRESLKRAVSERKGIYHSRKRGLWVKGETSGNTQQLLRVSLDCDRDAIRFTVRQKGEGFCHLATDSCWGDLAGLSKLEQTLQNRKANAPEGSYTKKLFDSPELLGKKITEEAAELVEATAREDIIWEAADVLYFTMSKLAASDITLAEVEAHLDARAKKVTRRG